MRVSRLSVYFLASVGVIGIVLLLQTTTKVTPSVSSENAARELASVAPYRPLLPRIGRELPWKPVRRATRGASADDDSSLRLEALALDISRRAMGRRDSASLTARALSKLFVGGWGDAIAGLESALAEHDQSSDLLNTLAAAYLMRANPGDSSSALALSDRALNLDADFAEAHFNRALALESLQLRQSAIQAWEHYLALESQPGWREEAAQRVAALRTDPRGDELRQIRRVMLDPSEPSVDEVEAVAERFPQEVRELAGEVLFPRWAEDFLTGRQMAHSYLHRARRVAQRLTERGGDESLLNAVIAIENATPDARRRLALAHRDFASAQSRYERYDYATAEPLLRDARRMFDEAGSPFSLWADLQLAVIAYQRREYDDVLRVLEETTRIAEASRYLALEGRAKWVLALVAGTRGDIGQYTRLLDEAEDCFTRARETENTAAVDALLAESATLFGEPDRSWYHLTLALERLPRVRHLPRTQAILYVASFTAARGGFPESALYFQNEAIEAARASDAPMAVVEGYLQRAAALLDLARSGDALRDLGAVDELLAGSRDNSLADYYAARANVLLGRLHERDQPREALKYIDEALAFFVAGEQTHLLPPLYLRKSRIHRTLDDVTGAQRDVERGLSVVETQLRSVVAPAMRVSLLDQAWELYEEALGLAIAQQQPDAAFGIAEHARARIATERLYGGEAPSLTLDALSGALGPDTAAIYYVSCKGQYFAWVLFRGSTDFVGPFGSAPIVRNVVAELQAMADEDSGRASQLVGKLFTEVMTPIVSRIRGAQQLWVIPDGALRSVPFGVLRDTETGRFLVQDYIVGHAPNAALLLKERTSRPEAAMSPALVIGDADMSIETLPDLRPLPGSREEIRRIASIYPRARVLSGREATKQRFLDLLPKADVVHFSGHALWSPDEPRLSSLLLSSGTGTRVPDRLFAYEIDGAIQGSLENVRLVVLSACGTGVGSESRGEGPLSVARPFLSRGVRWVVSSMWDLDDVSAAELTVSFHHQFRSGIPAPESLAIAQRAMILDGRWSLKQWGALSLLGGLS